ncbi:hypothetical protein Droror1_Dr00017668 [Drosera rotundifolia]
MSTHFQPHSFLSTPVQLCTALSVFRLYTPSLSHASLSLATLSLPSLRSAKLLSIPLKISLVLIIEYRNCRIGMGRGLMGVCRAWGSLSYSLAVCVSVVAQSEILSTILNCGGVQQKSPVLPCGVFRIGITKP